MWNAPGHVPHLARLKHGHTSGHATGTSLVTAQTTPPATQHTSPKGNTRHTEPVGERERTRVHSSAICESAPAHTRGRIECVMVRAYVRREAGHCSPGRRREAMFLWRTLKLRTMFRVVALSCRETKGFAPGPQALAAGLFSFSPAGAVCDANYWPGRPQSARETLLHTSK